MTKRSTAVAFGLAAMTLAGFVLTANLVGSRRGEPTQSQPGVAHSVAASPAPRRQTQAERQMHANLSRAQTLLDEINAAVATSQWAKARSLLAEFETNSRQLPGPQLDQPDISPVMRDFFALYRLQLARALNEQTAAPARFAVNQLFGIISEQLARLDPRGLPLEFARLRFLVRELELWAQANDQEPARLRAQALAEAWREVRPVIVARANGVEAAKHFDGVLEKTPVAPLPELLPLVAELKRDLDQMDALFDH